jgi:hypothetical protein
MVMRTTLNLQCDFITVKTFVTMKRYLKMLLSATIFLYSGRILS